MTKRYFVLSCLLLQGLVMIGSEKPSDLSQSKDNLRCSQEVPKLEKKSSVKDIRNNAAYYFAGYCGNFRHDALDAYKPLPPYYYHGSDCP